MSLFSRAVDLAMESTVVPSFSRIGYVVRSRVDNWEPLHSQALIGRTVLVTGANSGLGYAAAERMASLGASVRLLVRSDEKGERTLRRIADATGSSDVAWYIADLTDLPQTRDVAAKILANEDRLDVLVHNAGAMFPDRQETADGIERTVALHVVTPFLLTSELLPLLRRSTDPKVITVTSGGMYAEALDVDRLQSPEDYRPSVAYARAKRAQVVLHRLWAEHADDVAFHAMHPGWADTPGVESSLPVFRRITGPILRTPEEGADTIVWLAATPEHDRESGRLWHDRRPRSEHKLPTTRRGRVEEHRLWRYIEELVGAPDDPQTSPSSG